MNKPVCVVVGASHAGAQLAVSLRQNGWDGRILVIGDEPHLPYNRPPLSKSFLSGEKQLEDLLIRAEAQYEKVDIEFMLGQRVSQVDRQSRSLVLALGETLTYDKLVLATGSRVRKLDIPGSTLSGVFYLRDISDVEQMRPFVMAGRKAVIVGGGYIGLETAGMLNGLGMDVTILEAGDRVLNRVTAPELSAFYTRIHEEEGVRLETGVAVTGFEGEKHVVGVSCADGTTYAADLVVVGVGVLPNTELAEIAGLAVDNGIVVNEHCFTEDANIAAIGDCTSHFNTFYNRQLRLESVQNATDQARVAASTLCGKPIQYNALPWFWSDQYDLKLQIAGLSQGYDELVLRGEPREGRKLAAFYFNRGKLIAVDAVNSPQEFMIGKQLITRQIKVDRIALADSAVPMKSLLN